MKNLIYICLLFVTFEANAEIVPCDKKSYELIKNLAKANGYSWKGTLSTCKADESFGYFITYEDYAKRGQGDQLIAIGLDNPLRIEFKRGVFSLFCAALRDGYWVNVGKTCS